MDAIEKQKFLEAYDLYAEAIYRHCYFRVYSRERAEDLMQETFTKAWNYLVSGTNREVENWRALLYRIATNLVIDYARKKKEMSLEAMLENQEVVEPHYDGHKDIERSSSVSEVMRTLKDLPEQDASLFIMRYVDDMQPKEISEILDISANNVSVRLNHIAAKVRKRL